MWMFGVPSLSASCLVQYPTQGMGLPTGRELCCPEAGGIATHPVHLAAAGLALP